MPQFDKFIYTTLLFCFVVTFLFSFFNVLFLWCPFFLYVSIIETKYQKLISQTQKAFYVVKPASFTMLFYLTVNVLKTFPVFFWLPVFRSHFLLLFYNNVPFFINGVLQRI